MNKENNNIQSNNKGLNIYKVIIIILVIGSIIWLFLPKLPPPHRDPTKKLICRSNLKQLGIAFYMYAQDNSNSYPTPDKWCDLIKPYFEN